MKLLTEKKCSRCKQSKSVSEFYRDNRRSHLADQFRSYCKSCDKEVNRKRDWHSTHIQNRYGISKEVYNEILARQKGKCAICRKASKRRLAVDHDHDTGMVRGLICLSCNTALGWYEATKPMAEKFESYLGRFT